MMASVLSSIVLLFFPIACNAEGTVLITDPTSVNSETTKPRETRNAYTTSTNVLICTRYKTPFTIDLPEVGPKQFQCIAVLSKLVNGERHHLEVFVSDDCDKTADNLNANGDVIHLRTSPGYMMDIKDQRGKLLKIRKFTPSQWQKTSFGSSGPMDLELPGPSLASLNSSPRVAAGVNIPSTSTGLPPGPPRSSYRSNRARLTRMPSNLGQLNNPQ